MGLLFWAWCALAQEQPRIPRPTQTALAHDLAGERAGDRRYAARELRRQVRAAARDLNARDDLQRLEARADLAALRDDLGQAPERCLRHADVRAACAEMLGLLGDPRALPALQAARAEEDRRRVLRRLDSAILALEAP